MHNRWHRRVAVGGLAAAFALLGAIAHAQKLTAPRCTVYPDITKFDYPLRRTAERLEAGEPLRIVAIGSSSTAGVGASSDAKTYPSRLAVELKRLFPQIGFTVINRGVGGEEARQMLARLDTSVFAEHPDLVLWQVGTNAVLRDLPLPPAERQITEGIQGMKTRDIDVVMIDPQFAPKVIRRPEAQGMVELLAHTANELKVDLFRRYALMRRWVEHDGIPFTTSISPDRLHMNDWSYGCLAKVLAAAIAGTVQRPVAAAVQHRATR